MEILRLILRVTQDDVTHAISRWAGHSRVEDLAVRLCEDGVRVNGRYKAVIAIPFETRWELSATSGRLTARLAEFKAGGFGFGPMKSMLMMGIRKATQRTLGIVVEDESVHIDADTVLAYARVPLTTRLRSLRTEDSQLFIECGD